MSAFEAVTPVTPVTADEQARRSRLDAVMATRAARWCVETVADAMARDEAAGRPREVPGTVAHQYAQIIAADLVRAVWVRGAAPSSPHHVEDAWRYRAMEAWGALHYLTERYPGSTWPVVSETYHRQIGELEAADAAMTWHLRSERSARPCA